MSLGQDRLWVTIPIVTSRDRHDWNRDPRLLQWLHDQQLISPVVDDLHRHLLVLTGLKSRAGGAGKVLPQALVVGALERFFEVIPGASAREERLANVETAFVV